LNKAVQQIRWPGPDTTAEREMS